MIKIKMIIILAILAMCEIRSFAESEDEILKESGVSGGLVVHLGCGDGSDIIKLRINERFIVQGLDTTYEKVQEARKNIQSQNKYGNITVLEYDGKKIGLVLDYT